MIYGRAYYIDENDQITGFYNTAEYSFARLMQDCCVCQPAAFWRTRIAHDVGPFNEELNYVMDFDYWLRIAVAGGKIHHSPQVLAASRLYPQTKTMSARDKIFQEIFQVCQEHGGYVDLNYFHGLWHYRCWECSGGWPTWFRKLPHFYQNMARLHCRWYHRRWPTLHEVAHYPRAAARMAKGGAISLRDRFRSLVWAGVEQATGYRIDRRRPLSHIPAAAWRKLKRRNVNRLEQRDKAKREEAFRVDGGHGRRRVFGWYPDNWLEQECEVWVQNATAGNRLRLVGTPPCDTTLTVTADSKLVTKQFLSGSKRQKVLFHIDPGKNRQVKLHFSHCQVDTAKRKLAFLLEDTNLFLEQDTWGV
jgi:hypothetical protein